ncbi:class I adenylate-forming enzyme family protein [Chloroflexota bacterium]
MPIVTSGILGRIIDHDQGIDLSPSELRNETVRRRGIYYSLGMRRGSKAIICHGNSYEFFADLLALWEIGVCCIPVDSQTSANELANLIRHCDAKLLIYKGVLDTQSLNASLDAPILTVDSGEINQVERDSPSQRFVDQNVTWEDEALILYTSGSTGEPKGVLHTFRSLMARLYLLRADVGLGLLNTSLTLLPTNFGHGLICNSLYPLLNGCTLVILPAFNVSLLSDLGALIDRYQISFMSSVPTVWKMALRLSAPPKSATLKRIHCGSAPLGADLFGGIRKWCGTNNVKNTYGITEVGSWLAGTEDDVSDFIDGYIGKGWGTDIIILDDGSDPSAVNPKRYELPVNGEGDVWVRTPALMAGYYKRPDLTAQVVKNTWFSTGDKGYKDNGGSLVLVGRKRHEINKAGMKIYPEDIDLALEQSPDVADVCTFAIDDPLAGQVVGVAVVLKSVRADLEPVKAWLKTRISPHKFPTKWFPVDSIPKDTRGKVNREKVAESCLRRSVQ